MRLVRTQARTTRSYLKEAEALVLEAIKNREYKGLRNKLIMLLGPVPDEALKLIKELALYESKFISKQIESKLGIRTDVADSKVISRVEQAKVGTTTNGSRATVKNIYKTFVANKIGQLMQAVSDGKTMDEGFEETSNKVSNLTNGLFTVQNLALATIAISMTANVTRAVIADEAGLYLQWAIDLELNNCPYCEAKDGEIYLADDVEGEIPVHARCGCTLIPVENNE